MQQCVIFTHYEKSFKLLKINVNQESFYEKKIIDLQLIISITTESDIVPKTSTHVDIATKMSDRNSAVKYTKCIIHVVD